MDKATRSVNKFGQDVAAAGKSLATAFTLPIGLAGAAALKASADMESLRMGLTAITHSSAETEKQLGRLKEVAKIPGLDFQGAVKGSINLQAAGFSAQMAERALKSFGNALATVGKGKDDLDGVNLVLTQILNKPKVMAQDLNQLRERLPQISQAMKAAFGSNVSEDIQKLGVTGEQFVNKIIGEFEKLPAVNSGLKNSFENLQDSAFQALAKIGDIIKPFAQDFIDNRLEPMIAKIKDLAERFALLPKPIQNTVLGVTGAAAAFPLLAIAIGQTITNSIVIAGALGKVATVLGSLKWLLTGPAGVVALIAGIGIAGYKAGDYLQQRFGKGADEATESLKRFNAEYKKSDLVGKLSHGGNPGGGIPGFNKTMVDAAIQFTAATDKHAKATAKTGEVAQNAGSFFILESLSADQAADAVGNAKRALREYADDLGGLKSRGLEVWSDLSDRVLDFQVLVDAAGPAIANVVEIPAKSFEESLSPAIREAEAAMHSLGITSTRELRAQYDAAVLAARAMVENGASIQEVSDAMERVAELHKKVAQRTGEWDNQLGRTSKTANLYARQVSTAISDVGRSIADVITLQKRWGDAAKDLGRSFVRIIAEDFIAAGFGKLVNFIKDEVLPHLGKVGKSLAGILGGGASSAASGGASAAGSAASAAGSAGSAGAGAAGAAGSGVMGTIGAVSAAVGAVSSVVGNFQMAGMNKSLDVLVNHTLRQFNVTAQMLDFLYTWNGQWFKRTGEMWQALLDIKDAIGAGGSTGGRGGITFNHCNFTGSPDQIANAIFTQAQLAGAI